MNDHEYQHLLFIFATSMTVFEDVDSPEEKIVDVIRQIKPRIYGPGSAEVRTAFEYWETAFGNVRKATTRDQVKEEIRTYICTDDPLSASPYNIAQGLMKATVHLICRKLYALEAGRPRTDVSEAVRDAVVPPLQRGQEFMQAICAEIAAETSETTEQMIKRVAE